MLRRSFALTVATAVALSALAGCSQVKEKPGNPDSFTSRAPGQSVGSAARISLPA